MTDRKIEAELLAALHEGLFETPLWSSFLLTLRRATEADHALLVFQSPVRPYGEAISLYSGNATPEMFDAFTNQYHPPHELYRTEGFPEGKAISPAAALAASEAPPPEILHELDRQFAIRGIRVMRVAEKTGVEAMLTISRRGKEFAPRTDALMEDLAPALRGMLRIFVEMERERFAASLSADTVKRLQFGWITLDRSGHVLDCDEQGAHVLEHSGVLKRGKSGRLAARPSELEREIADSIARMARNPHSRSRAITLNRDPWLDMLLTPARNKSLSTRTPAVIAYVHGDSWNESDRCDQIADLFALTPAEARIALVLSRGMTVAEAASEFALAQGTVRNHLKAIYAKTGARGQPDLVRIVMRSIAAIAPQE